MFRRQNKTRTRVRNGLFAVAGAVSAFFGARALMAWLRQRSFEQEYPLRYSRRRTEMDMEAPGSSLPADIGSQPTRMPMEGTVATGRTEVGTNYTGAYESAREQEAIPATGMGTPVMERPYTRQAGQVETDQPVPVGSLVGPLIVHLLSFHNMMELLRRRRETEATMTDVNVPDVREGGADAVGSLESQLPEFDRAAIVSGSLQERIVQMMDRIRDTLQNKEYSDDQLFHISDELRPGVCKVLELIQKAGQADVTGFEDVQKSYRC
jgi:hypothetical protein